MFTVLVLLLFSLFFLLLEELSYIQHDRARMMQIDFNPPFPITLLSRKSFCKKIPLANQKFPLPPFFICMYVQTNLYCLSQNAIQPVLFIRDSSWLRWLKKSIEKKLEKNGIIGIWYLAVLSFYICARHVLNDLVHKPLALY